MICSNRVPAFDALEMDGLAAPDIPLGSSTSDSNSSSDQQENSSLSARNIEREATDPVKASLKSKIQKKYLENGKTPLQVSFDPPPKYEVYIHYYLITQYHVNLWYNCKKIFVVLHVHVSIFKIYLFQLLCNFLYHQDPW